jgi:hypothetical protein
VRRGGESQKSKMYGHMLGGGVGEGMKKREPVKKQKW